MSIPCKECLKYPICKHKEGISCSLLFYYMVEYYHHLNAQDHWKFIKEFIPNAERLMPDENTM